ncbi:MAG: ABC transporter substrate-binding protein [Chloroflexota bacterium]
MKGQWQKTVLICVLAVVLVVALVSGGCAPREKKPGEMTKVVVAMDWYPYAGWCDVYIPQVMGWYAEENLEVEFVTAPGRPHRLVGEKTATFGHGSGNDIYFIREAGLGVVAVAGDAQGLEWGFYGRVDKNPQLKLDADHRLIDVQEMQGMTIGGTIGFTTELVEAFLATTGLKGKLEYVIMESGAKIGSGLAGKIDAFTSSTGTIGYFKDIPGGGWFCDYAQGGIKVLPGMVISAHEDTIRDNPELVEAFVRAYLKGLKWSMENPQEAADLLVAAYPKEAEPYRTWYSLQTYVDFGLFGTENTKGKPLGWMSEKDWETTQGIILEWGRATTITKRPVSEYFTNEFIPK